jgi:hypothetical protein
MSLYLSTIAAGPAGRVSSSWVVATVQDVEAAGLFVGGSAFNGNGSAVYLQVFGVPASEVELGTTVPIFTIAIPAGRSLRLRPPRPIRCPNGMSFAATGGRTDGTSPAGPITVHFDVGGADADLGTTLDPASLNDTFNGGDPLLENRGWTWYDEGSVATQDMSGGELHLVSTGGGAAGAWWYNTENGNLLFKQVTGDFDVRVRLRVRDAAGTGSPSSAAFEWRFAGIAVHDPDRSTQYNYVHAMLGADPNGTDRIEWKTTDDSASTWDSVAGSAPLDYDLRIVRVGQVFSLYYRRTDSGQTLASNTGWTLYATIDRNDNTVPVRASAVPMPDTVQIGLTGGYAGPQASLDIQAWFDQVRIAA